MSEFLQRFAHDFAALNKDNLERVADLYSDNVSFTDPLHHIQGLPAMQDYFAQLYSNVSDLHFDFHRFDEVRPGEGYLVWTMSYSHPRLKRGRVIKVEGCSHLHWQEKVYRHRDYFDAGALLYEHLPIMGGLIAWLKKRLA
ncbi:nuclear transport factor 2 family protein [Pseudomonas capsici]|uniref:nuclear transport factor 2 family protein n=1 Tax=Pseudomonas capsici TaxID=2810614 RepID=UPI00190FFD63|nr:nuclear transport factor 2 family protein [Pseudomonas capsici]MCV4275233.1 nuclear transport factor 2 family protein [Pseudomonas capsici]GFM73399.1 transcriptional regulator [Pseudomonas cichorii]